jgi:hypothetical protein
MQHANLLLEAWALLERIILFDSKESVLLHFSYQGSGMTTWHWAQETPDV